MPSVEIKINGLLKYASHVWPDSYGNALYKELSRKLASGESIALTVDGEVVAGHHPGA